MFVYRAYQFRMYPTKDQKEQLNKNLGSSRFIYNYYLSKRHSIYQTTRTSLSLADMKKDLVSLQKEYSWLKEIDSCVLRTALDDLERAYQSFFKERGGFPHYKSKGKHESYRTVNNRSIYKGKEYASIQVNLEKTIVKLPKVGEVEIRGYRNLKEFPFKILNATITSVAGRYYVSICVEESKKEQDFRLKRAIGIDVGVKNTICCSDGLKYQMPANIKRQEHRLKRLQQRLSKSEKGSNNRRKLILKIQRAYQKIRNIRKYFIHEVTSKIVKENDLIVTETLAVKDMIENKQFHLSKQISNSSFSEILRQLKYKVKWKGKRIYQVEKYYPSSQICNHCGERNQEVKDLSIRKWKCMKCGNENDRDINASLNLEERGINKYFQEFYQMN